jgi:hypothetical protein
MEVAPSSRPGFLIIGLFDRRMGEGWAIPPSLIRRTRLLRTSSLFGGNACRCEDQLRVVAGKHGTQFGATRVRAILRVFSSKS